MDEDPSNNDPANLIPLCPNCHLTDLHDPTRPMDVDKLRLFRTHRDPVILTPQFHPLFLRMKFLLSIQTENNFDNIKNSSYELVRFVSVLQMGEFYGKQIETLTKYHDPFMYFTGDPNDLPRNTSIQLKAIGDYIDKVRNSAENIISLVVELLRFQNWTPNHKKGEAGA